MFSFLTIIADSQKSGDIHYKTAQSVFGSVLHCFVPRIKVIHFKKEMRWTQVPILLVLDDMVQLLHQCASLELKHHLSALFSKLDRLSRFGDPEIIFEGFFLPLMKKFDEMPPGQTPGTAAQEFHYMAHQLEDK